MIEMCQYRGKNLGAEDKFFMEAYCALRMFNKCLDQEKEKIKLLGQLVVGQDIEISSLVA